MQELKLSYAFVGLYQPTFNRTMQELKLNRHTICAISRNSFNRTMQELKHGVPLLTVTEASAFNRTMQELKHADDFKLFAPDVPLIAPCRN